MSFDDPPVWKRQMLLILALWSAKITVIGLCGDLHKAITLSKQANGPPPLGSNYAVIAIYSTVQRGVVWLLCIASLVQSTINTCVMFAPRLETRLVKKFYPIADICARKWIRHAKKTLIHQRRNGFNLSQHDKTGNSKSAAFCLKWKR
jgi:hypothetical protein